VRLPGAELDQDPVGNIFVASDVTNTV
jgi:hypothetical protein